MNSFISTASLCIPLLIAINQIQNKTNKFHVIRKHSIDLHESRGNGTEFKNSAAIENTE